jgi:hypothetical protein
MSRTQYRPVPFDISSAGVTDLRNPLNPQPIDPRNRKKPDEFRNKNGRATFPVQVIGLAASVRVLGANPRRTGLIIQNKDAVTPLYIGYGTQANVNSFYVGPLGSILEDFTCPSDEVWVYATTNVQAVFIETTRKAGS